MKILVKNRTSQDRGASMVEYGLLVALIAIVSLAAVGSAGRATEDKFDVIAAGLEDGSPVVEEDPSSPSAVDEETADSSDEENAASEEDPADGGPLDPQAEDEDEATAGPGDDEAGQPSDEAPIEPGASADPEDTGDANDPEPPGSGGEGETDPEPETPEEHVGHGSTVASPASEGAFYWWNETKHGGEGAWQASVSYQNDWIRHQYLTLEVTRIDEKGRRSTTTVNSFYVPAGGSSSYVSWDNAMELHKGDYDGVVSIEVKVTSIKTSDEDWQPVTYATDGPTTVVAAPSA